MVAQILRGLAQEKIVQLNPAQALRLPFALKGIIRLIDKKGNTLGILIDKKNIDEIQEETQACDPDFIASLDKSRLSGRVSGQTVKKRLGLK